jgi:hypothetical protein
MRRGEMDGREKETITKARELAKKAKRRSILALCLSVAALVNSIIVLCIKIWPRITVLLGQ